MSGFAASCAQVNPVGQVIGADRVLAAPGAVESGRSGYLRCRHPADPVPG
ncbi:hypothetical protein Aglo03_57140 [Actinokineospora globicatena]|uniref:Uncharacterized protein n=1 Tax=Actinokineospora globicatena TaxID=103729 RepID=A0A9W6QQX6_9PSEU|nr:hypothetical protein Aglo03_57140 [Actinokineospora globicatena]